MAKKNGVKPEAAPNEEPVTTRLRVPPGTGSLGTGERSYRPDKDGIIAAATDDVPALLRLGCVPV